MNIRIGTRASKLALWQANRAATRLRETGHHTELVTITTTGDRRHDVSLAEIGGKGLFVREIEEALLADQIDVAVHSLKDVPSIVDERFVLAAYLERGDVRDAWISSHDYDSLPEGARVGTSSPRRRAQLLARHKHANALPIRGNVETRIAKLDRGDYDGIILAAAGLERLGLSHRVRSFFPATGMIPAAGQATIAIETLATRIDLLDAVKKVNDARVEIEALAEREVLQHFGTLLDCHSPIAVNARVDGESFIVNAVVYQLDGERSIVISRSGATSSRTVITRELFDDLVAAGARQLLKRSEG